MIRIFTHRFIDADSLACHISGYSHARILGGEELVVS
jgi:hypothetical protein